MGKILVVDNAEEFASILQSAGDRLVVADFWATWCGPCRLIGPAFEKMSDDKEFESVTFVKIDVDEAGELAEEWEIKFMPTFMMLKNGEKIDEFFGADKDSLREMIQRYM